MASEVQVLGRSPASAESVLSAEALAFLERLARRFEPTRQDLLRRRAVRQARFDAGEMPDFLPETASVRREGWRAAATPADLERRWVEITGPVERKMMINALNSGADVFMADFEDSLSPTWENVVSGQANLIDAVRGQISWDSPEGKSYRLNPRVATLLVRPRGWHLAEKHVSVDGQPVSASLFDFGLYVFHNARERIARGTAPYFYLPKMESHLEARLWNDVFVFAQDEIGIPRGTFRATVLVETLPAAFEMDEILYELRDHASGLNAGRWDYLFSAIKTLRERRDLVLPERAQLTMTVPFMRAYTELLVATCHRRGAHAMGGMAPFIPSRKDPEVNEAALAKVRQDKNREAADGFDGTWVAHPGLVEIAREVFEKALAGRANQKERLREDVATTAAMLIDTRVPGGSVSEAGFRNNVNVALQYLNSWLLGNGAAAIFNLMEDVATAEISRSQLWQWIHNGAALSDGRKVTRDLYRQVRGEEMAALGGEATGRLRDAAEILDELVEKPEFTEFLTFPAYRRLE
ncbi:MAG: malate synthase A [Acidobacteria bacterium]|nr:malate synthase A [Acidobacteriota bacterium]MCA1609772.1 malate synthase A [Acidobacteriota bacterium]